MLNFVRISTALYSYGRTSSLYSFQTESQSVAEMGDESCRTSVATKTNVGIEIRTGDTRRKLHRCWEGGTRGSHYLKVKPLKMSGPRRAVYPSTCEWHLHRCGPDICPPASWGESSYSCQPMKNATITAELDLRLHARADE